ncbi:MAG: dihydrolipoyl dehydrogenase [Malacoplasma sp.]|mgnify:CR=1 FL=1|nr:dihydrolipoyl dehydrogenase [Malacoplasma sp.]
MKSYDVIIIGSGPGGYIAAEYAAKSGLKTLCVEAADLGGVCLNKGCIPTKALLSCSKIFQELKHATDFGIMGIDNNSITVDWKKILDRKDKVVKTLQMGVNGLLKAAKSDLIRGKAKIIDTKTIEVNDETIEYKYLVVATGSVPRKFNLPGFEEGYSANKVITSDEALNLDFIPKKFTVIGGGVIGIEFAILYSELGSEVTILQGVDRILEVLDNDVSIEVTKLLEKRNIKIVTDAKILRYADSKVFYEKDGKECASDFDYCLVSVGRTPDSEIVKAIGVECAPNGSIITNAQMKTNIDNVYAIGDCTSKVMLAHSAYKNAIVAIDSILNKPAAMDNLKVPGCIYTHPQVATIGYTEAELVAKNYNFVKAKYSFGHLGMGLASSATFGFIKMLVEKSTGEILGCHIVGENASDYIAEIALAMENESTVKTIADTIHPHPTYSEIVWEVARKIVVDFFNDKEWF